MARVDSFLRLVVDQRGSDLHLRPGSRPLIRHDGRLLALPYRELRAPDAERFVFELLDDERKAILDRDQQVDFAYDLAGTGRFRAHVFQQRTGLAAVFRVVPELVPTIEALGLPPALADLAALRNGLVVVSGPSGCGKSTTLAAMLEAVNRTRGAHVVTIEDPIEFLHSPGRALFTQREVGAHVASTAVGLRSALRESPDVLMVSDLADPEVLREALAAAETGVLVLGGLHGPSALAALRRLLDGVTAEHEEHVRASLARGLRAVVCQRLVPLANGEGRTAAVELLSGGTTVADFLRRGDLMGLDDALQEGEGGSVELDRSLVDLVAERLVSRADALAHARSPQRVAAWLDEVPHAEV